MAKLTSISFLMLLAFISAVTKSNGQAAFEFFVSGDNVIETGIRNFTIWNNEMVTIVCSTDPLVPVDIIILKNSTEVKEYTEKDIHSKEFLISYSEAYEGFYTCRITFASTALNKFKFLYTLEVNLLLNKVGSPSFCATNVGESGFIGEEVTLICNGNDNRWRPGGKSEVDVSLSLEAIDEYVCRENGPQPRAEVCRSHLQILPSLELKIIANSDIADFGILEFTCESAPPRLLYWGVWGDNGDILDLENYASSLKVDTNVTITQRAGETTLRITEAVPGGNGIYAVECFTYETKTKIASIRVLQERNCKSENNNVVYIITIVLLVLVIIILSIVVSLFYFNTKKNALPKRDVKPVEAKRTPTMCTNAAYVSQDGPYTNVIGKEQEYTYIDQK